ncbi:MULTISPECIES: hypothetical protein [unclassified Thiocapsa]|uniref:hypothetical protein n=1 Tax=unclassified Thiocapsa TaxID=2641286 RepID=UPI0035B1E86F
MWFQQLKGLGATALMAATLTPGGPVRADTPSPSIADCAAIQADQARLACYDRASGRLPSRYPYFRDSLTETRRHGGTEARRRGTRHQRLIDP